MTFFSEGILSSVHEYFLCLSFYAINFLKEVKNRKRAETALPQKQIWKLTKVIPGILILHQC